MHTVCFCASGNALLACRDAFHLDTLDETNGLLMSLAALLV